MMTHELAADWVIRMKEVDRDSAIELFVYFEDMATDKFNKLKAAYPKKRLYLVVWKREFSRA